MPASHGRRVQLTKIDPWFLVQIEELVRLEEQVKERGMAGLMPKFLRSLKRKGFADARLAKWLSVAEGEVRKLRAQSQHLPRSTSGSIPARPSSPPTPPTCTQL